MTFDYAIVGAGLSGLMLASRLVGVDAASSAIDGGPRVLLVVPAMHHHRGTAFAFWTTRGTPLDRVLGPSGCTPSPATWPGWCGRGPRARS